MPHDSLGAQVALESLCNALRDASVTDTPTQAQLLHVARVLQDVPCSVVECPNSFTAMLHAAMNAQGDSRGRKTAGERWQAAEDDGAHESTWDTLDGEWEEEEDPMAASGERLTAFRV